VALAGLVLVIGAVVRTPKGRIAPSRAAVLNASLCLVDIMIVRSWYGA
jgi:hypothetical protein